MKCKEKQEDARKHKELKVLKWQQETAKKRTAFGQEEYFLFWLNYCVK